MMLVEPDLTAVVMVGGAHHGSVLDVPLTHDMWLMPVPTKPSMHAMPLGPAMAIQTERYDAYGTKHCGRVGLCSGLDVVQRGLGVELVRTVEGFILGMIRLAQTP